MTFGHGIKLALNRCKKMVQDEHWRCYMAMAPVNLDHHFCDYNTFSLIEIRYAIVVCLQS